MAQVYLCGPITGLPDNNKPAFLDAQRKLVAIGFTVFNPHNLCEDIVANHHGTSEELWQACMKRDIPWMLKCDLVILLPGWSVSRGASIERALAQQVGIPTVLLDEYISTHQ
jgi:hypothetical protein